MCNIMRSGSVTANLAELEEGEARVDQPIIKKSKIGAGMRLSKEVLKAIGFDCRNELFPLQRK